MLATPLVFPPTLAISSISCACTQIPSPATTVAIAAPVEPPTPITTRNILLFTATHHTSRNPCSPLSDDFFHHALPVDTRLDRLPNDLCSRLCQNLTVADTTCIAHDLGVCAFVLTKSLSNERAAVANVKQSSRGRARFGATSPLRRERTPRIDHDYTWEEDYTNITPGPSAARP